MNANQSKFLKAVDVAQILQVSETTAYRIIKKMNVELQEQGKIIVAGKISRKYFEEKVYL
jgi:transcriptional antiterminator